MNLFRIMQSIRGWAQAGKIDFPGAVKYLTDLGVKMDGIVHQALKNVFKEGKARDPEFGNVVQKLPIDDQGIPFHPNTLKSTKEKRSIRGTSEADKDIAFIQEGINDLNKVEREADLVSESKGIENLFDEKLPNVKMGSRMNYEKIADLEGIDVELIRGKNWSEIRAILAAVRDKADGGRVGFVEGGWADDLTGQGLSIYNSMTAGGHGDEAIQNTLKELGYWPIPGATGIETIVNTGLDQGGGGDGGGGGITNGYNVNQGLGTTNITDYEAEAYGIGPTWGGTWASIKDAYSKIPTPLNLVKKGVIKVGDWINEQKEKHDIKKEQKLQAEIDAANKASLASIVEANIATYGTGDRPNTGINAPGGGKGQSPTGGDVAGTPFDEGGLATMFTRRR